MTSKVYQNGQHRSAKESPDRGEGLEASLVLGPAVLLLIIVTSWVYWPIITSLLHIWQVDVNYSVGQLVPMVALFLVWAERKNLKKCSVRPCWWGGLALLVLAQVARLFGLLLMYGSIPRYTFVPTIMGLVLMVAGWQVFRTLFWIMMFLFLMLPLPGPIHNMVSGPLQIMATTGAVFLLEAFGVNVSQQGNVINMNETSALAVAEACSGLRMLTAFVVVAAFIAYMIKRSRGHKIIVLFSSIPVSVICNIVRIFLTALFMLYVSEEFADKFFHDFAGYVMMPVAVLLIFGELWLMDKLFIADSKTTG
jgi:exosortase